VRALRHRHEQLKQLDVHLVNLGVVEQPPPRAVARTSGAGVPAAQRDRLLVRYLDRRHAQHAADVQRAFVKRQQQQGAFSLADASALMRSPSDASLLERAAKLQRGGAAADFERPRFILFGPGARKDTLRIIRRAVVEQVALAKFAKLLRRCRIHEGFRCWRAQAAEVERAAAFNAAKDAHPRSKLRRFSHDAVGAAAAAAHQSRRNSVRKH